MSAGGTGSATPLVRIAALSKAYRDGAGKTPVLDGASLELPRGATASLTGASGSGKSTLISLIAGLLRPDAGEIVFDGTDIASLDDTARARIRARRIGVVLQSGNLIPFLTAAENVELAMLLASEGRARRNGGRAKQLLGDLGLGDRLGQLPRQLSGGEAQRVAVAVALANEPDLLLADEPTGELDSATADQVMGAVFEASRDRGLTVLFATHSRDLAERAQVRLTLEQGQVRPA